VALRRGNEKPLRQEMIKVEEKGVKCATTLELKKGAIKGGRRRSYFCFWESW
jgi:hypothetical protein